MKKYKHLSLLITLPLAFISFPLFSAEVSIAVASNFTHVSREIAKAFEQETGHKTKISYGSTGKLYAQIANGAPFEVYLSADSKRPIKAEKEGLAVANSRFVYAKGKLVLWTPKENLFKEGMGEQWFKKTHFKRIAIGNPKTVPYGLAAQQVIKHIGNWKKIQKKLVRGDSIAQTFQFVSTANVAAGFVAESQVQAWHEKQSSAGTLWRIPTNYYQAIKQSAVLLKKGETKPAAKEYLNFLKSKKAQKIIKDFGYDVEPL